MKSIAAKLSWDKRTVSILLGILALAGLYFIIRAFAGQQAPDLAPLSAQASFPANEVLIKVKPSTKAKIKSQPGVFDSGEPALDKVDKSLKAKKIEQVTKPGRHSRGDHEVFRWYKVTLPDVVLPSAKKGRINKDDPEFEDLEKAAKAFRGSGVIEEVEPNSIVQALTVPNDPFFGSSNSFNQNGPDLWGLKKINAEAAWDQATGSNSIIVANIDTGVDRNHEDIKDNMWVNSLEVPNNRIDDDGNGYIDDYFGWNFLADNNNPMDDFGHGTHTVGTIGARGNNALGVVGVNWQVKIMALKFLGADGSGPTSAAIKALQYAADMGAKVSSNSWGCACQSRALEAAIKYEHDRGMVVVAAAGNNNADALTFSPASADYAITVAATGMHDQKACFSNWGAKIDVAAPGGDAARCGGTDEYILSARAATSPMCTPDRVVRTTYCIVRGTSMAAPHVAGLAALLWAKNPNLTNEEIRQILRTGSDDLINPGQDHSYGYGRINAAGSMAIADHVLAPVIISPSSRSDLRSRTFVDVMGMVPGPNFASYKLEIGQERMPASWETIAASTVQPLGATKLGTIDMAKLEGSSYTLRLAAVDTAGNTYYFSNYDLLTTPSNFTAAITTTAYVSKGLNTITGTVKSVNPNTALASYKLEWGSGTSPRSWSTVGMTLAGGGITPVSQGVLGSWEAGALTAGTYSLRLTATSTRGSTKQVFARVTLDQDLVGGWPKIARCGRVCSASMVLADINNDGQQEVIVGDGNDPANLTAPANLHAYTKNGSELPGFPIRLPSFDNETGFAYSPEVVDLDNDGKREIVTVLTAGNLKNRLVIIRGDGTLLPGWPQPILNAGGDQTPIAVDLDDDGRKELLVMDPYSTDPAVPNAKLHAYRLDGSELPGWPKSPNLATAPGAQTPGLGATLTLADLGNGVKVLLYPFADKIYAFNLEGQLLPGWPYSAPLHNETGGMVTSKVELFRSAVSLGDINGAGQKEIIAGSVAENCAGCDLMIHVIGQDGVGQTGWPRVAGQATDSSPYGTGISVADLNLDHKDEILSLNPIQIWGNTGLKLTSRYYAKGGASGVADIDGDGKGNMIALGSPSLNQVNVLKDAGQLYWQKSLPDPSPFKTTMGFPTLVSDLDGNNRMEIAVSGARRTLSGDFGEAETAVVTYLWEVSPIRGGQVKGSWPMYGHDPLRTGNAAAPVVVLPRDTESPTVPTNLSGNAVNHNQINLIWNASSDNIGVAGYEIYRNSVLVTTVTGTSYGDAGLTPATSYSYYIRAKDLVGNFSPPTPSITVTTPRPSPYGSLTGTITRRIPGGYEPITGARVRFVAGQAFVATSNSSGVYNFTNVPPGSYSATFSAPGYTARRAVIRFLAGVTTVKDMQFY